MKKKTWDTVSWLLIWAFFITALFIYLYKPIKNQKDITSDIKITSNADYNGKILTITGIIENNSDKNIKILKLSATITETNTKTTVSNIPETEIYNINPSDVQPFELSTILYGFTDNLYYDLHLEAIY